MIYAIKLGPIETGEGRVNAFVGIRDDGHVVAPVISNRDTDGLRQLAAEAASGEPLLCEKRLARAGGPIGFAAADMPSWVPRPRAALAAALALGMEVLPPYPDELDLLFRSSNELWRARPWRYWTDNDPIAVTLSGAVEVTFEGALMGAAGMEYGVALYRRPGALERIARNVDLGRMDEARQEDSLAVTFDDQPRFAITALRAAYGLAHLPVPMKLAGGDLVRIERIDLALLGLTLRLLTMVSPDAPHASLSIGSGAEEITMSISMAPGRAPMPN